MDYLVNALVIGAGATTLIDLWAIARRRAFDIPLPNYALVGRWFAPPGSRSLSPRVNRSLPNRRGRARHRLGRPLRHRCRVRRPAACRVGPGVGPSSDDRAAPAADPAPWRRPSRSDATRHGCRAASRSARPPPARDDFGTRALCRRRVARFQYVSDRPDERQCNQPSPQENEMRIPARHPARASPQSWIGTVSAFVSARTGSGFTAQWLKSCATTWPVVRRRRSSTPGAEARCSLDGLACRDGCRSIAHDKGRPSGQNAPG